MYSMAAPVEEKWPAMSPMVVDSSFRKTGTLTASNTSLHRFLSLTGSRHTSAGSRQHWGTCNNRDTKHLSEQLMNLGYISFSSKCRELWHLPHKSTLTSVHLSLWLINRARVCLHTEAGCFSCQWVSFEIMHHNKLRILKINNDTFAQVRNLPI